MGRASPIRVVRQLLFVAAIVGGSTAVQGRPVDQGEGKGESRVAVSERGAEAGKRLDWQVVQNKRRFAKKLTAVSRQNCFLRFSPTRPEVGRKRMKEASLNLSAESERPLADESVGRQFLYRETLNRVEVFTPIDSASYRIESSTGKTVKGTSIRISPSVDAVVLQIYADDQHLGTKRFEVVEPPRPQVTAYRDSPSGEQYQISCGEVVPRARPVLRFEVEPDSTFAAQHPEDARYRVRRAEVRILPTGLDEVGGGLGTFDLGEDGLLRENLIRVLSQANAQPGDRLEIRLREVVRINHQGDAIAVDLNESAATFIFLLR